MNIEFIDLMKMMIDDRYMCLPIAGLMESNWTQTINLFECFALSFVSFVILQPLFLHRNLSYMTGRMSRSRTNSKRKISQSLDMWDTVQHSKKRTLDVNATHSMRLEFFSFFDKKQPMHTLTKIEFIALNGRTDSKIPSQHTVSIE